ncbi:MAG: citramalate synthase [Candidatus Omnitrophica bacterium]|nr:citramalate synthase [Candidatus Omnitrophota bacterium]
MKKITLYDTTLRDGSQSEGISFSVADKVRIAQKIDELGIQYIEGGWPGSNPKDMEFFKAIKKVRLLNATITAFGATRRARTSPSRDANMRALLAAGTKVVTIFGKSWDLHVKDVFKVPLDENLKMISDSVIFLKKRGKRVFYDAEHFFDGYKDNPEYALKTLFAAQEAGAEVLVLCDTNGGTLTSEIFKIVEEVRRHLDIELGIHTHNDSEMAVSNSVVSVQAGCTHIQGTINGYGERCGNANLISIVPILKLKMGLDCVSAIELKELTEASRFVSELSNMKQLDNQPFVGNSAFAHKGGVHVNAVIKNPRTYEHLDPALVGNRRRILISELSGKSSILAKAKELNVGLDKNTNRSRRILKLLQDLEHKGYHFEAAEASLELLMKRAMKRFKSFFELGDFRVIVERREGAADLISEATVKLKVGNKRQHTAALGDGPVNALDNALRKALKEFYPSLEDMHLSDFKVRVLDEKAGTAAKVRVLIQSQDRKNSWWTVGVSENIIKASWDALVDSIEYKLLKDQKR